MATIFGGYAVAEVVDEKELSSITGYTVPANSIFQGIAYSSVAGGGVLSISPGYIYNVKLANGTQVSPYSGAVQMNFIAAAAGSVINVSGGTGTNDLFLYGQLLQQVTAL